MKYYLFKSDNCELLDTMFEGYLGDKVELTEDNLDEMIDALVDLYPEPAEELESLRKDTLIKLRKVLE